MPRGYSEYARDEVSESRAALRAVVLRWIAATPRRRPSAFIRRYRTIGDVKNAERSYEDAIAVCEAALLPLVHLVGTRKFKPSTARPLLTLEAYLEAEGVVVSAPAFEAWCPPRRRRGDDAVAIR